MEPYDSSFDSTSKEPDATPRAPRPSGLLMANSVVVIVVSSFLLSLGISNVSINTPENILSGLFLGLLATIVGVLEYAASFRQNDVAARTLRPIHTAGFILCLMAAVYLSAQIFMEHKGVECGITVLFILGLLLICFFAAMSEWGFRRWLEKLDLWQDR